jgi:hypothetical protein
LIEEFRHSRLLALDSTTRRLIGNDAQHRNGGHPGIGEGQFMGFEMETFKITYNQTTITVPIDVSVNYLRRRFNTAGILGVLLPTGVEYDLESTNRLPLASLDTVLLTENVPLEADGSKIRKFKIFVSTGHNDGTGDPKQAKITAANVELESNTWIQEQRNNIKVIDIQVIVDSKQHGNQSWNGACVSTVVVHYYDIYR